MNAPDDAVVTGRWDRAVALYRLAEMADKAGEHPDADRYRERSLEEAREYRAQHAKPLDHMVRMALDLPCNRSVSVPPSEQQYGPDAAGDYWYMLVNRGRLDSDRSLPDTANIPVEVSVTFVKVDLQWAR